MNHSLLKKTVFSLLLSCITCLSGYAASVRATSSFSYHPDSVRVILEEEQRAAFNHFWQFANKQTGMIHASTNVNNKNLTTGGSGFGVMVILTGIERGWITRKEGAKRILTLVRYLDKAERIKGVWSHWMNVEGQPVKFGKQIESGDLVETSFMMMGLYAAQAYLTENNSVEKEIRKTVDSFRETIQWSDFVHDGELYWLWERTNGTFTLPLRGYNEALITYILALGAPDKYAVNAEVYKNGWQQSGKIFKPRQTHYGYPFVMGAHLSGPLFLSHYSFLGMNPKAMQDNYVDYQQYGTYHAMIHRHYCMEEAPKEYQYDAFNWGLSAGSGPNQPVKKGYKPRTPKRDDGVIAPTAALSSMPYTPFYSIQMLLNLHYNCPQLHTPGGFGDGYSPVDNWYFKGRIAIDQAPIVIMIENYRSGFLWKLLANHPDIRKGMEKAGIHLPVHSTGFPYAIADTRTGYYDMIRHPDRRKYELDFYLKEAGTVSFQITDETGTKVLSEIQAKKYPEGLNLLSFDGTVLKKLKEDTKRCIIRLIEGGKVKAEVKVQLN